MIISLRISEADARLFKTYARSRNMSVSKLIRETVLERIEKDYLILRSEIESGVIEQDKNSSFQKAKGFEEIIN